MSKKYLYGVKYLVPFDMTTMKPKGIFEVIGGVEIGREVEKMALNGGHQNSPYAIEAGQPENSLTATLKEYPNFAFEIFENAVVASVTSETLGYVGSLVNSLGTSISNATTGVASASIIAGEGATIPSGMLVLEGTADPTKVNVYLAGDVASGKVPIVSELPLIGADVVVAGTGGTVDLAGYGVTLTGGSGSTAFVEGDIAYVEVRPANTEKTSIKVGADSDVNYIGVLLVYPRNAAKEQKIVRFPNVAVVGMSFNANSREFSEFEQEMIPLQTDDSEALLYEIITTKIA